MFFQSKFYKLLMKVPILNTSIRATAFLIGSVTNGFLFLVTDTSFATRFFMFFWFERGNKNLRRITNESYVVSFPVCFFSNFPRFVKQYLKKEERFLEETQRPGMLYCSFLYAKPWYHDNEINNITEIKVDKIKAELVNGKDIIQKEYLAIKNHASVDQRNLGAIDGDWTAFPLYSGFGRIRENCNKCPKTLSLIENLPLHAFGMSYFSIMHPETHIKGHYGPTNARLRYHLGLDIPPDNVYFRVGREINKWKQDGCIVLDDSFYHEVFQQANRERVVFITDCWHPDLTLHEKIFITKLMYIFIKHSKFSPARRKIYK